MKANKLRKYCLEYLSILREERSDPEVDNTHYHFVSGQIRAFEILVDKIKNENEKEENSMNQYDIAMVELFELYLSNPNRNPEWFDRTAQILKRIIENKREAMWLIREVQEREHESE